MITTLTVNPAIDKTVIVDHFAVDKVNRIQQYREDPGGKGINVSKMVQLLGEETTALGFAGGIRGNKLLTMIKQLDIPYEFVMTVGETRINNKIIDLVNGTCTDLNEPGQPITEAEVTELKELVKKWIPKSDYFILSGGVQTDISSSFYKELIEMMNQSDCKVMIDTSGVLLEQAIQAKPWLIKPNIHELEELVGKKLTSFEEIIEQARKLIASGIQYVAVSMGEKGMLLVSETEVYHGKAPKVDVKSTVGAGDSTVAALAVGFYKQLSLEQTLRKAVAAGTAAVTMEGTNVPEKSLINSIEEKVIIQKL